MLLSFRLRRTDIFLHQAFRFSRRFFLACCFRLFSACVCSSGVYLGATAKQLKALSSYAEHLGLAFQIADDILDATSTQKELGKPVKADVSKGFPHLIGLDRSRKLAKQEKDRALSALRIFDKKADILREVAEYVVERRK